MPVRLVQFTVFANIGIQPKIELKRKVQYEDVLYEQNR